MVRKIGRILRRIESIIYHEGGITQRYTPDGVVLHSFTITRKSGAATRRALDIDSFMNEFLLFKCKNMDFSLKRTIRVDGFLVRHYAWINHNPR
jgi:hypothetical protein